MIYSTKWGIGTSPDSAAYIGSASNLLNGKGLSVPYGDPPDQPLSFYPPLYPIFLSLGGLSGYSIFQSSRWLHVILLSLNLLLLWLFIRKLIPSSLSLLSSILLIPFAISPSFFNLHIMAWSEALFLLTGYGGLFLVATGLSQHRKYFIIQGSFLLGLAFLTRYSGLAMIAAAGIAILIFQKGIIWTKLHYTIYATIPALVMASGWMIWNFIINGNFASRSLDFHLIETNQLRLGLDTIANWFLIPLSLPGVVKIGILATIITPLMLFIFRGFNKFSEELKWIVSILATFFITYPLFLLVSISFIDANTPLDDRILSPLFIVFGLLMITAIGHLLNKLRYTLRTKILLASLGVLLFSVIGIEQRISAIHASHNFGIGFGHIQWRDSELIHQIKQFPADSIIYTNSPEGVYLLTGKPSIPIPRKIDLTRRTPNPNFQEKMNLMRHEILIGNAVIAYFSSVRSKAVPDPSEMIAFMPASKIIKEYTDGLIIGVSK